MLGAVLFSTLGVACGGALGDQSNAPNLDSGSVSVLPAEASAADSAVSAVGADANGSGDPANSEAGTTDGGGNLIVNPSCEDATFDWTTLSGTPLASSATYVHTGAQHSCCATMRTDEYAQTNYPLSSYDGPLQDITAVVSGGHEYSFSVWVLWAPPGALPAPDSATADDGSVTDAGDDAANEAGATYPLEEAYVTLKETCILPNSGAGPTSTYVTISTLQGIPEATWTQITSAGGGLKVPENCTDIEIYIGGPNIGMDLYTDEATLLFVQ